MCPLDIQTLIPYSQLYISNDKQDVISLICLEIYLHVGFKVVRDITPDEESSEAIQIK